MRAPPGAQFVPVWLMRAPPGAQFVPVWLMRAPPGAQFVLVKCQIIFQFEIVLITGLRAQNVLLFSVFCRTSCVRNQLTGRHNLNSMDLTCFGSVTDSVTGCQ
jgi:hypothetical protein